MEHPRKEFQRGKGYEKAAKNQTRRSTMKKAKAESTKLNGNNRKLPKKRFAMRVEGHCMAPTILNGDVVSVDPEKSPSLGSIVVIKANHQLYLKRWNASGTILWLTPDNATYPICKASMPHVAVLGVAVAVIYRNLLHTEPECDIDWPPRNPDGSVRAFGLFEMTHDDEMKAKRKIREFGDPALKVAQERGRQELLRMMERERELVIPDVPPELSPKA